MRAILTPKPAREQFEDETWRAALPQGRYRLTFDAGPTSPLPIGRSGDTHAHRTFPRRTLSLDRSHHLPGPRRSRLADQRARAELDVLPVRSRHRVPGPAIIEETFTTIGVYPGWQAVVDDAGDYELTRCASLLVDTAMAGEAA